MYLWQMDLVGGVFLADGRECKMLTGIDDHSRYVVIATVLAVPSGRAVSEAFLAAMRVYGVPSEVLTDNGKQFTGRFTKPRPAEVLFERVCRENGITAKLTKPYSPTTTGKIERWHQTLRRELLDDAGPFADLPTAQAAITAWVTTYNHARPHQSLDMATPATLFRPSTTSGSSQEVTSDKDASPTGLLVEHDPQGLEAQPVRPVPVKPDSLVPVGMLLSGSAQAVEFDTIISASGQLNVVAGVQRIRMGATRASLGAHVWADENSIHIIMDEVLVKTVPSNLSAEDLQHLRMRGALPAGPPPAPPAPATSDIPAGAAIEVDRTLDGDGCAGLAGQRVKIGPELQRQRVTLRLDGHLMHVVHDGHLAKTLPSPIETDQRAKLRGARIAATQLPPPHTGPISVQRRVPRDGIIMVTRQRLRIGRTYAGRIVTVHVEDTHFRITCEGVEISLHPRKEQRQVTRWKAKIHAPRT